MGGDTCLTLPPSLSSTFSMSPAASKLTPDRRRQARRDATYSALFGTIPTLLLDNSAVIITYIALLGGGNMFSMLSSSLISIASTLLLLPMVGFTEKLGLKASVRVAGYLGCATYMLMAAAPFFGSFASPLVIIAAFAFCLTNPLYVNAWYPLLDGFLLPQERSHFFGQMRFLYQLLSSALFLLLGLLMGKNPPLWFFQIIIVLVAISLLGRSHYIDRLPLTSDKPVKSRYNFRSAFKIAIRNGPLVGFSVYVCFVSLGYTSIIPLVYIYMKSHLELPPNMVVSISSLTMIGIMVGYLCASSLQRLLGTKWLQILCHLCFIAVSLACFCCGKESGNVILKFALLLMIQGFATACFGVCFSTETLALASPGNKTMASAFCNTYSSAGHSVGRLGTSLVLGSMLLAPSWQLGTRVVSSFQTLFLIYAVWLIFCLLLLVLLPAVVPVHEDYYQP
ncbi:MAG: MFS transporter [Oligosphaeraceae bacterium]|nr:MFS transporter [Oligosphaeraceae bacterium]